MSNIFTDEGCDHQALRSAVDVLRIQQAQPHRSTEHVLWEAIKDYAERAITRPQPVEPPDDGLVERARRVFSVDQSRTYYANHPDIVGMGLVEAVVSLRAQLASVTEERDSLQGEVEAHRTTLLQNVAAMRKRAEIAEAALAQAQPVAITPDMKRIAAGYLRTLGIVDGAYDLGHDLLAKVFAAIPQPITPPDAYIPQLIEYSREGDPYVEFVQADEPTVTRSGLRGELLMSFDRQKVVGLRVFITPLSQAKEPVAWEGYWPGAGSVDSVTKLTRFKSTMEQWKADGAEITPLGTLPHPTPVTDEPTITKEMDAEWYLDANDPGEGHNNICDIIDNYASGAVVRVDHAAVVKSSFHVWLLPADDADSDDNWEFEGSSEAECLRALVDEKERRAALTAAIQPGGR